MRSARLHPRGHREASGGNGGGRGGGSGGGKGSGRGGSGGSSAEKALLQLLAVPREELAVLGGAAMEETSSGIRLSAECLDEPPNSRVFVVLGKDTGEALIRERFSPFGDIQNIWLLRDRRTNESRGIAFIKFARSSQACRAMEEMHGRSLLPDSKPIKVRPGPGRAGPAAGAGPGERPPGRPCLSGAPPGHFPPRLSWGAAGPVRPQHPTGGLGRSRPAENAAPRNEGVFVIKCCKQDSCE